MLRFRVSQVQGSVRRLLQSKPQSAPSFPSFPGSNHVFSVEKLVFLHNDRYVEFHAQYGKYHKIRIPKYGRDFDYHYSSCDLYFVGATDEIFRFNLEQGCFQSSLKSSTSSENYCCEFNPDHELFACGNAEGIVECWDPRAPKQIGLLNCNVDALFEDSSNNTARKCGITCMKYRDGLNLAIGTSTGHVTRRCLVMRDLFSGLYF